MAEKKLGLIVNPVAGLGGRVGLKGSDGEAIQRQARARGAKPQAGERAERAIRRLASHRQTFQLITYPAEMGEVPARRAGLAAQVVGAIQPGRTTPQDTQRAAREMQELGVGLLLFAGGDGTARDIYAALGEGMPALGIPAGVKIHSATFAITPEAAGELAAAWLTATIPTRSAEVMDIDETAFRQGRVSARLCGYLRVPFRRNLVQAAKSPSPAGEEADQEAIAIEVARRLQPGWCYLLGPGTTTRAIAAHLGLEKSLLGVDVICDGCLIARDVDERQLLEVIEGRKAKIILTPIGGQGHILGRGNQPISPSVLQKVGPEGLVVVSTRQKIDALRGAPLRVDSGDPGLDRQLSGYTRVITGYGEECVYRVSNG